MEESEVSVKDEPQLSVTTASRAVQLPMKMRALREAAETIAELRDVQHAQERFLRGMAMGFEDVAGKIGQIIPHVQSLHVVTVEPELEQIGRILRSLNRKWADSAYYRAEGGASDGNESVRISQSSDHEISEAD